MNIFLESEQFLYKTKEHVEIWDIQGVAYICIYL